MEIEIPLSVKVNIAEDKANINDIVKAIGQVLSRYIGTEAGFEAVGGKYSGRALCGRGYCGASSQGEAGQRLSGEERLDTKGGDRARAEFHHPAG